MIWSFSNHGLFRKCQRQWYFKNVLANAIAKAPERHEAHRLSKLCSIYAWRGKVVDAVISDGIIPAVKMKRRITLEQAKAQAKQIFMQQRAAGMSGNGVSADFGGFFEVEYGLPLTDQMFNDTWGVIDQSITELFKNEDLRNLIKSASHLFPQRALMYKCMGVTVRAVPDLIAFFPDKPPLIIDWKVQANPTKDHWLQLATYAIALVRANPHKDWPPFPPNLDPCSVELIEVQLLTGQMRPHKITTEDEIELQELVAVSSNEMLLVRGDDDAKTMDRTEFSVTYNPRHCEQCPFKKLCWEATQ